MSTRPAPVNEFHVPVPESLIPSRLSCRGRNILRNHESAARRTLLELANTLDAGGPVVYGTAGATIDRPTAESLAKVIRQHLMVCGQHASTKTPTDRVGLLARTRTAPRPAGCGVVSADKEVA